MKFSQLERNPIHQIGRNFEYGFQITLQHICLNNTNLKSKIGILLQQILKKGYCSKCQLHITAVKGLC